MSECQVAAVAQQCDHTVSTRILVITTGMIVMNVQVLSALRLKSASCTLASLALQHPIKLCRLDPVAANVRTPITETHLACRTGNSIPIRNTRLATGTEAQGICFSDRSCCEMVFVSRLPLATTRTFSPLDPHPAHAQATVWPITLAWRARFEVVMLP